MLPLHVSGQVRDLKRHLAIKHDVDVTWFECPSCEYKSTRKGGLKAFDSDSYINEHKTIEELLRYPFTLSKDQLDGPFSLHLCIEIGCLVVSLSDTSAIRYRIMHE